MVDRPSWSRRASIASTSVRRPVADSRQPKREAAIVTQGAVEEGVPPTAHASVLEWLASVKLQACHPALDEQGYGDDIDMVLDGDEEEVSVMLSSVMEMEGVQLPIVKKFKRELAKLRGRGETFR